MAPPTFAVSVAASTSSSVQTSKRLDELGKRLTNKYYAPLQSKDIRGLEESLSPAFQLQRANGTGADRSGYLADLPTVSDLAVSPAPRIPTYVRDGGRWQLVSHANFNTLQG